MWLIKNAFKMQASKTFQNSCSQLVVYLFPLSINIIHNRGTSLKKQME